MLLTKLRVVDAAVRVTQIRQLKIGSPGLLAKCLGDREFQFPFSTGASFTSVTVTVTSNVSVTVPSDAFTITL